ncbi:MAG: DUF4921 family protein [Planctomycetaceae bacterium]
MSRFFAEQPPHSDPSTGDRAIRYPQPTDPAHPELDLAVTAAELPTKSLSGEVHAADLDTRRLRPADVAIVGDTPASAECVAEAAVGYDSFAATATNASPAEPAPPSHEPAPQHRQLATHSRYDAITGRWTIFAVGRDQRPCDFINTPPGEVTSFDCPFCSGNEHQTPAAVLEIDATECDRCLSTGEAAHLNRTKDCDAPWAIRVIPNKYPAVDACDAGDIDMPAAAKGIRREDPSSTLFLNRKVTGGHEVFIESPDHHQSILTLDLAQVTTLLRAYQIRMLHWREVPSVRYLSLFKNVGSAAGASLHHSHSQLIATSELPIAAKTVAERMKFHWAKTGCCLQCDTIRAEVKAKQRVVATTGSLIAYCPYGSHLPMLLRITTRRHLDRFEDLTIAELQDLARLLRGSIRWMQTIYPDVAYNYLIHTRPPGVVGEEMAHWALEVFPRITQVAGFEWSSDCMINPVLPEIAAAGYREIALRENPLR